MKLLSLDFETYFAPDYSLSNKGMSIEKYVRDPRFETIAVTTYDGEIRHRAIGAEVGPLLQSFDWDDIYAVSHNFAFDGFILKERYGILPHFAACTQRLLHVLHLVGDIGGASLAKVSDYAIANGIPIQPKGTVVHDMKGRSLSSLSPSEVETYLDYCQTDTDNTYAIFNWLAPRLSKTVLQSMSATLLCSVNARFIVDQEAAQKHRDAVQKENERLLKEANVDVFLVRSDDRLAAALEDLGVDPPSKLNAKGLRKHAFAKTDKNFTDLLEHEDQAVQALVAARLGNKTTIAVSRAQAFVDVVDRGPLPFAVNFWGAHTGRLSAGGVSNSYNFTNLPRNGILKRAIQAPKGFVVISADSTAIELRVAMALANQTDALIALREGRDLYSDFGSELFGKPVSKKTPIERFIAKQICLSAQYGVGPDKMQKQSTIQARGQGITLPDISWVDAIKAYKTKYSQIPTQWRRLDGVLKAMMRGESVEVDAMGLLSMEGNTIIRPNGAKLIYDGLSADKGDRGVEYTYRRFKNRHWEWKHIYAAALLENISQALATDIIYWQWLQINARARKEFGYKFDIVAAQVYDEIVVIAPEKDGEAVRELQLHTMQQVPQWASSIPIAAEIGPVAYTYGDA